MGVTNQAIFGLIILVVLICFAGLTRFKHVFKTYVIQHPQIGPWLLTLVTRIDRKTRGIANKIRIGTKVITTAGIAGILIPASNPISLILVGMGLTTYMAARK